MFLCRYPCNICLITVYSCLQVVYAKKEEFIRKRYELFVVFWPCALSRPCVLGYLIKHLQRWPLAFRFPATRPGGASSTSRAKRVVSCKRKTHHLVVVRRKLAAAGRPCGTGGNKENEVARTEEPPTCMDDDDRGQEMSHVDPWEFPLNVNKHQSGGTGSKHTDCFTLGEVWNRNFCCCCFFVWRMKCSEKKACPEMVTCMSR